MKKKILALGLSAVSAATIMIGTTASPAQALEIPNVCLNLPGTLLNSGTGFINAGNNLNAANTDLTGKRAALDTSIVNYVTAFANHLKALDGVVGSPVPSVTQAALDAAGVDLSNKASAWGNAKVAQWNAQHNFDLAQVSHIMNSTLDGLLCP